MSAKTPILFERDNVNDESVVLLRWHAEHGAEVQIETLLAEVETSKANVEVFAHAAGYLQWNFAAKATVPLSEPIGFISPESLSGDDLTPPVLSTEKSSISISPEPGGPKSGLAHGISASSTHHGLDSTVFTSQALQRQRFSRLAEKIMRENNLTPAHFAGITLVRKEDVLNFLNPQAQQLAHATERSKPATPAAKITHPYKEVPLSKMKRFEGATLAAGVSNAISSAVSVTCFTRGLRKNLKIHPIETGYLSAVIVYEVGRLLRKYPTLNATYRNGLMLRYEQVNVGFALDDGQGLKVAVFHGADEMTLPKVAEKLIELTTAYIQNKLTPTQISNGTFTISDLSGLGVSSFYPLISENQGAILGISGEQFAPDSSYGFYTMTLTFDHQLSDGRTAARFLNDLKKRLQPYEDATAAAFEAGKRT